MRILFSEQPILVSIFGIYMAYLERQKIISEKLLIVFYTQKDDEVQKEIRVGIVLVNLGGFRELRVRVA